MIKKKALKLDYYILGTVGALLTLGILTLAGVSAGFSQERFGNTTYFLFHQILVGIIPGLILGYIAFKIPLAFLKKYSLHLILFAIALMLSVFIPGIGIVSGGAPRWLNLGLATFQPSELLKLAFVIYFSAWLVNPAKREKFIKDTKNIGKSLAHRFKNELMGLAPFGMVLGVIVFLLLIQSDISTLVVFIALAVVMYWTANTPLWHTASIIAICITGILALIKFAPYRVRRVMIFLDPNLDPMGMGYQLKQIMIAIGSGGIFGLGLGESIQKFGFIPQTMADSIFAIYAEELGFIGAFVLVALYAFLFYRGFLIFIRSKDSFAKFLAIGMSFWICFQAFFNISAMTGILPLTGIPLPFISYGGSHIISELIAIGLLLNVSRDIA